MSQHPADDSAAWGDHVASATFREAMSRVAAAVHVVTTDGPAGRHGFTATAFASVSADPPMVLVCLWRASRMNEAFRANRVFAVNALAPEHRPLAEAFAGRTGEAMEARFARGRWQAGATGAPLLADATVSLDCRTVEIVEAGSHGILIGVVADACLGADRPALIYHRRHFSQA